MNGSQLIGGKALFQTREHVCSVLLGQSGLIANCVS